MRSSSLRHDHPDIRAGTWPRVHPGFSLPELIVVMFLASVLAYVAVPSIEVVRFRMDGAARGAAATLMSAQRLAVMRQHDVVVTFDAANHRLRIHEDRDNNGLVGEGEPTRTVVFDDGVIFGLGGASALDGDAAVVTFTDVQDGLPALRYIRNGSASEEGSLYLTSGRAGRASVYAKDSRLVRVDRATGRVTWYRHEAPEWVETF